ncbi:Na+/solute symporter [Rhodothermus marinus SG0.5JP17-172]|uniref:sodium:solute symporter family protein n=1 Tax=Rhodothermus marinus TaxID=29549 RepID=UPI000223DB2D|nr:sodium:solute symporter family protein [Rhodothermus marinus]AEN72568.1 Na+/solute symporter [Rhodothermus marinus SG0.5JP17-172]MBO2492754.1 sodium:proline symporter [Rhodothermus marinus]
MHLTWLDGVLIAAYFVFSLGIALYYYRRAGKDTSEFFLSGRSMPWWLAGTSMVATTFAADTPLAVSELVAYNGIAGNWLWWNFALGGVLTVFFFARLWRRSGVLTDVEFVELRYSGPAAAWLRGIKAVYFGLLMNVIIIGWVSLAMETVIDVLFPGRTLFGRTSFTLLGIEMSASLVLVGLLVLLVGVYSLISGLWGVAVTDLFQFVLAMVGTTLLAVFALDLPEVGGLAGLKARLPETTFRMLPTIGEAVQGAGVLALSAAAFAAYVGVQWWASWYPGAEPGGGGYIAQRMLGAKDERHAVFSVLWFNIAHYCLRPWPWILTALVALVLFPDEPPRAAYVLVMRDTLPPGLLGLLFAAFLAAFMSTVSTQLNWGVSYLVNDGWRRFVRPDADEKHYVRVGRVLTFLLAVVSVLVTTQLESISGAWSLILTASGGLGLVLILRWYWWRVNAWSELTATLVPLCLAGLALLGVPVPGLLDPFPTNLFAVVAYTTLAWVTVTLFTPPTDMATLDAFYRRVRPAGPGWRPIAARHPDIHPDTSLRTLAIDWLAGVVLVYSTLFGIGQLLVGSAGLGLLLLAVAVGAGAFLWRHLRHQLPHTTPAARNVPPTD